MILMTIFSSQIHTKATLITAVTNMHLSQTIELSMLILKYHIMSVEMATGNLMLVSSRINYI